MAEYDPISSAVRVSIAQAKHSQLASTRTRLQEKLANLKKARASQQASAARLVSVTPEEVLSKVSIVSPS